MKQEAMQSDIRALMKLPAGRRVVWRLLEQAGVWRSVFNPEPLRMAFAEPAAPPTTGNADITS